MTCEITDIREEFLRGIAATLPETSAQHGRREIFGWTDQAERNFRHAERILVTLPHASPNVFFPRAMPHWHATRRSNEHDGIHLRIVLDHINFSDLGWRPYSWWYLDSGGALSDLRLFTRNKKKKHVAVCSRPPLPPEKLQWPRGYSDWLPRDARNLSDSFIGVMACDEAMAGLRPKDRLVYVNLSDVVAILRRIAERLGGGGRRSWLQSLFSHAEGRIVGASGSLEPCEEPWRASIIDNASMIAALGALGNVEIIGGRKMLGYWGDVLSKAATATHACGVTAPLPVPIDFSELRPRLEPPRPSERLRKQLYDAGIGYSQGLAVAEHGAYASGDSGRW